MLAFIPDWIRKQGMLGLSRGWVFVVVIVGILKVASVFLIPVCCDFVNWVNLASNIFSRISNGELPSVAQTGAYTGLGLFLALFFAVWEALPVPHPSLHSFIRSNYFFVPSTEGYALIFFMRLPIVLFDLLTAILIYVLVKRATGTTAVGGRAFLMWYLNPLNLYLMMSWSNPGAFDVVPAAVLLAAIVLSTKGRWLGAGVCVAAATFLRLFPVLLFPFFLVYSFKEGRQASIRLSLGFLAPIAVVFFAQVITAGSLQNAIGAFSTIPLKNSWVLNYYGFSIGSYLTLMPFLILVQLYLVGRYWRNDESLVPLLMAALLVVFATTYHQPYHFIWIMPLLTVYCATNRGALMLFLPLCISAFLYSEGYATPNSYLFLFQPLFAAVFFGLKVSYLFKVNLGNLPRRFPVSARVYR